MAGREDIAGYVVAVTITTAITDPDEAIRWVREQLAANLGTQGDEGAEGWHNTSIGTPRWQLNSVRTVGKADER